MPSKATNNPSVYFKDLNPNDLEFTVPEENKWSKSQNIGYIRYKNGQLLLKSDFNELSSGGVPREDEYHPSDDKRRFIKIGENDQNKEFFDKLREIDEILGSDDTKKRFFDKKASKYSYIPIVRSPIQDEDDEVKKPCYIKCMLCTKYPEGTITTNVFKCESTEDGANKEKLSVNTPDEAMKAVPYKSINRYIISPVKTWAQLPKMKDPQYGLTFKVIQVETIHTASGGGGLKKYLDGGAYIGDDNSTVNTSNDDGGEETVFQKPTEDNDDNDESEDDDSESESESESEDEEKPPPKPTKKKAGKK